jgi:zinc protease
VTAHCFKVFRRNGRALIVRLAAVTIAIAALIAFGAPANAVNIERVVSPGGIEFWFVRETNVPLVSINFSFRGGAVQDPEGKEGLAETTISTLDEGAGDLDANGFHERLERNAIELQFRASREHVTGTMRTLKVNQDEAFNLLRLALNEPRFEASAVERMRTQMLSQVRSQSTNPNSIASKTWWVTGFPGHPYGRPTSGTIESLTRLTADDMRDYVRRVFARDTLKLAVVGDIDATTAGRLLDRTFGALPAKAQLAEIPDATIRGLKTRSVVALNVPQTVVTFGGVGIPRKDPDFMAGYIVNHIFGGGAFTSRLHREVRETRGLAYGVTTSLSWFEHAAVLIGGTATRADAAAQTIEVIENVSRAMSAGGPTDEEIDKAKTYLKGAFALNLDTSSNIAAQLVQIQVDDLGIDYIERRSAMIDAVTPADARRATQRLLGSGLLFTVVGRSNGVTPKTPGG